MAEFMLFIRGGNDDGAQLTPEEIQQSIARYRRWAQSLQERGKLVAAEKLHDDDGRVLSLQNGAVVVDGPFPETKETIGGYFRFIAEDYAEAIAIARECPALQSPEGSLELRQIET